LGHGWERGVGKQASKALLSLSGEELERGKYGGGPVVVVLLARIGVAVPEPCRCPKFAAFAASSLHQLLCWDVGVALARQQGQRQAQNGSRLGPSSTETLLQFPQTHKQNALARSTMRRQQRTWQHRKLGKAMGVDGRRGGALGEARNSSITWIQDLETESRGPMSKTGRSWLLPRPSPSGSPFPDPSSTTHTTHATGQDDHAPSTLARAWDRVGASLLAFPRWAQRLFAHGDDGVRARVRRRFASCRWGRAVGGPSGINRSTTSTVFPTFTVYRPADDLKRLSAPVAGPPPELCRTEISQRLNHWHRVTGWLETRHAIHGCLTHRGSLISKKNRGTLQAKKKNTQFSAALRRFLGRPLVARQPSTRLMHVRVGFSIWTSGIF
jgi:hypothetical protein